MTAELDRREQRLAEAQDRNDGSIAAASEELCAAASILQWQIIVALRLPELVAWIARRTNR